MKALFWIWQLTWGLPQTLVGALIAAYCRVARKQLPADALPQRFRGAVITYWTLGGSLSLGPFLFLNPRERDQRFLQRHEFGHSLQSLLLGPLYLLVIGIPSLTWANLPACRARWEGKTSPRSYYDFYTERWANALADRFLQE